MSEVASLSDFCRRLLESGELAAKLAPPRAPSGARLPDPPGPLPAPPPGRPARTPALALVSGAPRLPRPAQLRDPAARAACLARFAHHELCAAELLAWALLRWPEAPAGLRRSWTGVLEDEQRHCRMYLGRLAALGGRLEEHPCPGYFWQVARASDGRDRGPKAFLAALGLTLEQGNLDFAQLYADAFDAAGDAASAAVCRRVHRDELRHVRAAARWLKALDPEAGSDLAAYQRAVPFPFSAARAKGRRFDAGARRRAGLSEALIEHVRTARSGPELAGAARAGPSMRAPRV